MSKNILDVTDDLKKYEKMIFITNLKDNSFVVDEKGVGVYLVGASISHSDVFLLLKDENQYSFHEINNFSNLLPKVIKLLYKDPKMNDKIIAKYVEKILSFYRRNDVENKGYLIEDY